ncbi:MAG: hypothetical protein GYA17_08920 [Chloroflexi bacterium]|nr:hypothetical protein [Anaerolineaceae bacterium]NMB88469.1 hypothetical protein [Chloroflexota bacterium]
MQSPQIGFTNRWKENLEERRLLQEKLQVRRFILFTVSISVLISFVLILITAFTASPANWLVALIRNFTDLSIHWNQTQSTVSFYLRALPPIIPISLWIILTSGFSLLTLAWIGTMWRISKQGVYSK